MMDESTIPSLRVTADHMLSPSTLEGPGQGVDPAASRDAERLSRAFATWRGRLIDLTKRNRALNYRPTKVSTLTVVDEKPAEIYRLLVGEERTLTFRATLPSIKGTVDESEGPPTPVVTPGPHIVLTVTTSSIGPGESAAPDQDDDEEDLPLQPFAPYEREGLSDRHIDSELQCRASPESLDTSLRRLAELQRTSIEEQGVNTLYLALGFLHYREAPQAETYLQAPVILVPVKLERQSARAGYQLSVGEDEPVFNPSLVEYLRRVHQITDMPNLPEATDDPASYDLRPFFSAIADKVASSRQWKVTEDIVLATFAFQKLVIFKDLEVNEAQFISHHLVRRVVLREGEPAHDLPPEIRGLDLDHDFPPEATHQVMDADSSQLRAIAAVTKRHDLVIHGPPGTGKSQTITNLVAEALGAGKRVLFVSEKMAALEVVHRRLTQANLGEFCLELHSTKASKGGVLDELKRTLQAHGDPAPGAASGKEALGKTRGTLNRYAKTLHQPRTDLACTAYQALGEYAAAFAAPRLAYPDDPTKVTPAVLLDVLDRLQKAATLGRGVSPVVGNGWRDARLEQFSEDTGARIAEALDRARTLAATFKAEAAQLVTTFGVPPAGTMERAATLADVADHLAAATGMPSTVLRDIRWATRPTEVADLIAQGQKYAALDRRLTSRYRLDELEEVDPQDVQYIEHKLSGVFSFLALLDSRFRAIRRRWRAMRTGTEALPLLDQAADLKQVPRWQSERAALASHTQAARWFGVAWRGDKSDWKDLDARAKWVEQFHRMVASDGPFADPAYHMAEHGGEPHPLPHQVRRTIKDLKAALATLRQLVVWPTDYLAAASVEEVAARLQELHVDLRRGPAWVAFVRAVKALAETPAHELGEHAFRGSLAVDQLVRAFRRSLYSAWLERVVPGVPELDDFSTAAHEEARRMFQYHDTQLLSENQAKLVTLLRGMGSSRYASSLGTHRAFLQKEFAKQKRHRPLRVTLREAGEAIVALKPCFLMSPLSVSQFLAPDLPFELVIFDEASQLPTEDAIAAICRGKQLVVVGDPKQLPPTNFFSLQIGAANSELDENGEPVVEETESVLEEFQGAGLHQAYLEWHYRSAHEALIQFSNERFYGNRLVVFPAAVADGPEFGVRFHYIEEGRYEGAGLNKIEAQQVAAAVVEHFRTHPHESLGVGTFNQRQQMAILDELERYRREDPALEAFFDRGSHEPFFVKNLENIQGDERDVVYLSITYARQADGRLRYNFGPLNRQEGWRRLNVLVSRARKRMRVFSSLKAADINPTATATQGPALLRDFLQFAETGRMDVTHSGTATDADSPFELEVGEVLRGMGYLVDRQVGVGIYRLDLGIRHPDRPGRYLAGIECDGAAYHAAPCARDRDRLRQQVLERRGWTILRVWSTDWFKDRTGTLERLKSTLEALRTQLDELDVNQAEAAPAAPEPTVVEVPETAPVHIGPRPYVRPQVPNYTLATRLQAVMGTLPDTPVATVGHHVAHIVNEEGPVHVDDVVARLLYTWGHERRGARLMAAAQEGIKRAISASTVASRGDFLYPTNQQHVIPRSRTNMNLGAERVAPEEIMAAVKVALAATDSLEEGELVSEVREILGVKRTQDGTARIQESIRALLEQGSVIYGVSGLRLRPAVPAG